MSGDSRKDFVLATTANHFGVQVNDASLKNLPDSPALNSFLDDGNASVLSGRLDPKSRIKLLMFSNKVFH
jgi:dynein heavy chain 2